MEQLGIHGELHCKKYASINWFPSVNIATAIRKWIYARDTMTKAGYICQLTTSVSETAFRNVNRWELKAFEGILLLSYRTWILVEKNVTLENRHIRFVVLTWVFLIVRRTSKLKS